MLDGWECLDKEDIARIEKGIIENHAYGGPYHIELHPTNRCDLNCFFCFSKPSRNNESLEWGVLKNLLIENRRHDLRMLHLTGGGDPITYDHIDDLIDLCRAEGIKIQEITTNATRLAPLAERIVDAGLGRITVSLGETDAARYARTMGGSKEHFYKAIEGIQAVVEARDHAPKRSRPRIWAMCMLWKGSAPYITQMYGFLRKLGVDTIFYRTIFGKMGNEKLAENERAMVESQLRDIIREDSTSREYRLHFDLSHELELHHFTYAEQNIYNPPVSENFPTFERANPRTEYCYVGWYTCSINALGKVYPCLNFHELMSKEIGNIYEEPLNAIWHGSKARMFRNQIQSMVRLHGRMEPSQKYNCYIEHKCTVCDKCNYNYNLATPDFYERVLQGLNQRMRLRDFARDYAKNAVIRMAHRLLGRPR